MSAAGHQPFSPFRLTLIRGWAHLVSSFAPMKSNLNESPAPSGTGNNKATGTLVIPD